MNHEQGYEKVQDECGVYGIYAPGEPVATMTYHGLHELQHRGQNGAGIAVSNGMDGVLIERGMGVVDAAIPFVVPGENGYSQLDNFNSPVAIGHTRYSTGGDLDAAQPFFGHTQSAFALAHNGHIEDIGLVAEVFNVDPNAVSDSALLTRIIDQRATELGSVDAALDEVLPELDGAFCLTMTDGERIIAVRDPWGFHPLSIGKLKGSKGYVIASESVAFDEDNVYFMRDVEPGEIVTIDENGLSSRFINRQEETRNCMFEYIYTARPDSVVNGRRVYAARKNMGKHLAERFTHKVDVVVGVPSSGLAMAAGFSEASGIPLVEGIFKNTYSTRSFITEGQERDTILRRKLRPNVSELAGRSIALGDDSLIKGNTMGALIKLLKKAGVKEVHVLSAAPRYEFVCLMGMSTNTPGELVASHMTDEQICEHIGADSIMFNTVEAIEQSINDAREVSSITQPIGGLCTACTTGEYPFNKGTFKDIKRQRLTQLGIPAMRRAFSS